MLSFSTLAQLVSLLTTKSTRFPEPADDSESLTKAVQTAKEQEIQDNLQKKVLLFALTFAEGEGRKQGRKAEYRELASVLY